MREDNCEVVPVACVHGIADPDQLVSVLPPRRLNLQLLNVYRSYLQGQSWNSSRSFMKQFIINQYEIISTSHIFKVTSSRSNLQGQVWNSSRSFNMKLFPQIIYSRSLTKQFKVIHQAIISASHLFQDKSSRSIIKSSFSMKLFPQQFSRYVWNQG